MKLNVNLFVISVTQKTDTENIMQIMWPSVFVDCLVDGPIHQRGLIVARTILGDDMAYDYDNLMAKAIKRFIVI